MSDTITAADAAAVADVLTALRTADVDTAALAAGQLVVASMSASGKVKTETAGNWHIKRGTADLWGIGYRHDPKGGTATSSYRANGVICGFARSLADADRDIAAMRAAGSNGRDKLVKASLVAMPAYVVHRDQLPALTAALTVAYTAWATVANGGTLADPAPTAPTRTRRGRKTA